MELWNNCLADILDQIMIMWPYKCAYVNDHCSNRDFYFNRMEA